MSTSPHGGVGRIKIAAISLVACSASSVPPEESVFPSAPYAAILSESKLLGIEVRTVPEQPPRRGTISAEFTITNAADGTPRDGLIVEVVPWMAAHAHGASVKPTVTSKGQGRYLVSNINLFMPGHWEIRSTFSGDIADRAAPFFDIE